jgi:hypothetical protein
MPKLSRLNKDYHSPLEIIGLSIFDGKLYKYFYPEDYKKHKTDREHIIDYNVIEGFHPFTDMGKDFVNTFKPYKTWHHIAKECLQPLRVIGNILRGISILILTVPAAVLFIGMLLISTTLTFFIQGPKQTAELIHGVAKSPGLWILPWFMDAVSSIVRGITQIVFTPVMPFKFLLRGAITFFTGWQKHENDRGIKKNLTAPLPSR